MMMKQCGRIGMVLALGCVLSGSMLAREVTLAKNGKAACVIIVPGGSLTWEGSDKTIDQWGRIPGKSAAEVADEIQRRLQRDSVNDLAHYLGKMSGTTIEVIEGAVEKDKRTPIYIGALAEKVFGPVGISKAGKYGFRVVTSEKGIGLYGESEYGTSYAIYELLHRLGCRWFMPTELGEVVPNTPALSVPMMDASLAPATEYRGLWQGGVDFLRRNRMNGFNMNSGHVLESYISDEQRKEHPEWSLHVDGKPHPRLLRWTRQDVANAIADTIIEQLDKKYQSSISLSPGDYVVPTEDPEEMKHDPIPRVWEPAAGRWSVSDRLVLLANRVAERVGKKYPDVLFTLYIYVNYSMPPTEHNVHPNVIPWLAPIDFNRHHPMTWPNHPNKTWLKDMVEGWGKVAPRFYFRGYGMNLAELSAPNPLITKWGTDIPLYLKANCAFFAPETMGGWDSQMPGYYLAVRMPFYPEEKPEAILNDLWTKFYEAAAEPMGRYWNRMDRAWIDAGEYAGAHWGYLHIFTPEVMEGARADIDEALSKCQTITEYRRVKLIDDSFTLFELYMKMRQDWAAGKLAKLGSDYDTWRSGISDEVRRYKDPADSTYVQGRFGTLIYPDRLLATPYRDASSKAKEYAQDGKPMLEWKWKYNPDPEADSLLWTAPGYDDTDWPTTHVVRDTWSDIGHHNTMTDVSSGHSGRMAYRTSQKLRAVPEGKKKFLWIGSTDGSAKLFVNGQHVKYVVPEKTRWNEAGDVLDAFSGYSQPACFDISSAVKTGDNQITILCERTNLNELGTGGLMGPVVIFTEK